MNVRVVGTQDFQDNWPGYPAFPRSKVAQDIENYWNEHFSEDADEDWDDDLEDILTDLNVEEWEGHWIGGAQNSLPASSPSHNNICSDAVLSSDRRGGIHDYIYYHRDEYSDKNHDDRWEAVIVLDYFPDEDGPYGLATVGAAGKFDRYWNRVAWVNMYHFDQDYTSWLDETGYVGVAMHELLHLFDNRHEDAEFPTQSNPPASYIADAGRELYDDWCGYGYEDPVEMGHFMSDCVFENTGELVDEDIKPYIGDDDPGGGCFITTAVHENPKTLNSLRRFRDESMAKSIIGKGLVSLYYQISPPIANTLEKHPESRTASVTRWIVQRCAELSNKQNGTNSATRGGVISLMITLWYIIGIIFASLGHLFIQTKAKVKQSKTIQ